MAQSARWRAKATGKKEEEPAAFRDGGFKEKLPTARAAHPSQRVCLWARDESRFGPHTVQRRRLTPRGVKPVRPCERAFENFWLRGALQPNSGENFALESSATDSDRLRAFLDQFAAAHATPPDEARALLMDNGGAHRAKAPRWPEGVAPVHLPACCPELNPVEGWWQELRDAVSNTIHGILDALRARVDAELASWNDGPEPMCSLTSYPYLVEALAMTG